MQLTSLIEASPAGGRLPSVRQLYRQRQVSVSTVMKAYRLLEDQGRVEVRPQPGHYVCAFNSSLPEEPKRSRILRLFSSHILAHYISEGGSLETPSLVTTYTAVSVGVNSPVALQRGTATVSLCPP